MCYQSIFLTLLVFSSAVLAQDAALSPSDKNQVLVGIFTGDQATKGERVYKTSCQNCHAIREYKGLIQQSDNPGVQISAYYDLISQSMPQDAPGSLSSEQYLNLMAYILSLNGFPAADTSAQ